jgi:polysaccharide pyruvyl transferase WcaK-like protein
LSEFTSSMGADARAQVVLSNVFADDNRGGAAITLESVRAARTVFPDCSIALIAVADGADDETHRHTLSAYPEAELLQPLVQVPAGRLGALRALGRSIALLVGGRRWGGCRTMQQIRSAHLVMSKGGQLFKNRRTIGGLVSVWLSSLPLLMGWRLGKSTVIYSATIGPIENRWAKPLVGWIIRRADWVYVRDSNSSAEAINLGAARDRVVQMPDCVFGRTSPEYTHCAAVAKRLGLVPGRFVAVTVTHGRARSDQHIAFLRDLSSVVRALLDHGVVDRAVVVAQVDGSISSDKKENELFLEECDDARVSLMDADLNPEDMIALYGAAALTIGCRVHSAIFSLVAGTPTWVAELGGRKANDLLHALGLQEFVVSYPEFDPDRLVGDIIKRLDRRDELHHLVRVVVAQAREDVALARAQLCSAIRSNGYGTIESTMSSYGPTEIDIGKAQTRTRHEG